MSSLLYRLGRWCAAHAWRTLTIWLVLLVGIGALAGTVGKPLTSQISIPGTTFQKVIDGLGKEIPEAAGGAGTVVLQSTDGAPISDAQRAAAEQVFTAWEAVPHVKRVANPFEAQASLDQSASGLAAAATKLKDGQAQLDAGRSFVFLFTDLANPTSNRIYQAIGYEPIRDIESWRFRAVPDPPGGAGAPTGCPCWGKIATSERAVDRGIER